MAIIEACNYKSRGNLRVALAIYTRLINDTGQQQPNDATKMMTGLLLQVIPPVLL